MRIEGILQMKVRLTDIIDEIDSASSGTRSYYNKVTGEIITQFEDYEDNEIDEELEENWDQYIILPTQFDIDEYSIMEEFISTIDNVGVRIQLGNAIIGRGAFRRFKDLICELEIANVWYDYLEKAHEKIAIEWCEDNQIEYIK